MYSLASISKMNSLAAIAKEQIRAKKLNQRPVGVQLSPELLSAAQKLADRIEKEGK